MWFPSSRSSQSSGIIFFNQRDEHVGGAFWPRLVCLDLKTGLIPCQLGRCHQIWCEARVVSLRMTVGSALVLLVLPSSRGNFISL